MYLKLLRTMSVYDDCGVIGTPMANPFVAITSGGLKTDEPVPLTKGQVMQGPWVGMLLSDAVNKFWTSGMLQDYPGSRTFKSLNVAELECPTAGVGSTLVNSNTYTTIGPPWLPYIVPPLEISTLQPIWSSQCVGRFPNEIIGVFDPPRALIAAPSRLIPTAMAQEAAGPTPNVPHPADTPKAQSGAKLVAPGPTPTSGAKVAANSPATDDLTQSSEPKDGPKTSKSPEGNDKYEDPHGSKKGRTQSGGSAEVDPDASKSPVSSENDPKNNPAGQPQLEPSVHADDSSSTSPGRDGPKADPASQSQVKPHANAYDFSSTSPDKANSGGQTEVNPPANADTSSSTSPGENDPKANTADQSHAGPSANAGASSFAPSGEDDSRANSAGHSAGKPPANDVNSNIPAVNDAGGESANGQIQPDHEPLSPITIGGQGITPAASGFSIRGTTISPGGPAATIAHTPLSLDASGVLYVGSQTISLRLSGKSVLSNPPASPITVASQTFAAAASGFSIKGMTVKPGGPAVTIAQTRVSLAASGILMVGSQTISLATPAMKTTTPLVFTVGQETITPQPSGFFIADKTVLPGGTAVNYSGTRVSLGSSGQLIIGTRAISLPAETSIQWNATHDHTLPENPKYTPGTANPSESVEVFTGGSVKSSASLVVVACTALFSVLWC